MNNITTTHGTAILTPQPETETDRKFALESAQRNAARVTLTLSKPTDAAPSRKTTSAPAYCVFRGVRYANAKQALATIDFSSPSVDALEAELSI